MTSRKLLKASLLSAASLLMASAHANDQHPAILQMAVETTVTMQQSGFAAGFHDTGMLYRASLAAVFKTAKAPQVPLNPHAAKFMRTYLKRNAECLQKTEKRSEPYFRIIESILGKYGIPPELKYLAVVESDLIRTAVSRVGAAGPWQLMPGTARALGLRVSRKNDERKNYYKSTTAAAKYLRDLYNEYEDWLLVIAAYNAGPGNVNKAIRKAGSRNFWKLQSFLPAETRGHVKRFISTHYFFEDAGSQTTLTKAENSTYAKALAKYNALQQKETTAPKHEAPEPCESSNEKDNTEMAIVAAMAAANEY